MKDCLLRSDCVVKDGNKPSDCLRNHTNELPEECRMLRKATFDCKRGMVSPTSPFARVYLTGSQLDMRNRFRGNPGSQFHFVEEKPTDLESN
jgi:cytochrome c oxidase assembly factor 5